MDLHDLSMGAAKAAVHWWLLAPESPVAVALKREESASSSLRRRTQSLPSGGVPDVSSFDEAVVLSCFSISHINVLREIPWDSPVLDPCSVGLRYRFRRFIF